jgi:hypothetical protein
MERSLAERKVIKGACNVLIEIFSKTGAIIN